MIDYKLFQFASPPRTATTWFLRACDTVGLGNGFKSHVHSPPPPDHRGKGIIVSLVRHPYDWLVSYYYGLLGGSVGVTEVDEMAPLFRQSRDFWAFGRRYIRKMPGTISKMFEAYWPTNVMRVEDLPWAAVELFEMLGIKKRLLKDVPRIRPANFTKRSPYVDFPRLRKAVVKAEKEFCDRYDYV